MRLLQLICRKDKHGDDEADSNPKMAKVLGSVWSELNLEQLLNTVIRRNKVTQAVILDRKGDIIHATSGWTILPDDGHKMGRVVGTAPVRAIWKVYIFGHDFYCFHCDHQKTILGRGGGIVMAAHVTRKYIVVGLADELISGSCLYEMKQVWGEMEARGL